MPRTLLKKRLGTSKSKPRLLDKKRPKKEPTESENGKSKLIVLPEGTIEIVDLCPELAQLLLDNRPTNEEGKSLQRKINRRHVENIKRALELKTFVWTGAPILLDPNMVMLDGQHRGTAVIETGITLPNQIVITLRHPDAFRNIDVHVQKRSISQVRHMAGRRTVNGTVIAAIVLEHDDLIKGKRGEHTVPEKDLIVECCDLQQEALELSRGSVKMPSGTLAVALKCMRLDKERGFAFFDAVRRMDYNIDQSLAPPKNTYASQAKLLADWLMRRRMMKDGFTGEAAIGSTIEKSIRAWNAWCEQREMKHLPSVNSLPKLLKPNWT